MATGKAVGEKDKGSEQSATADGGTGEDDWQPPTAREAGSGMATGKAAEAKDHGSQREGVDEEADAAGLNGLPPGEATERNKLWNASNFRRDAVDEDDDGPSTLLDLSGTADGEGAVADLDLDGMPDVSGLDLDGDADADGVDLESLALDS